MIPVEMDRHNVDRVLIITDGWIIDDLKSPNVANPAPPGLFLISLYTQARLKEGCRFRAPCIRGDGPYIVRATIFSFWYFMLALFWASGTIAVLPFLLSF